MLQASNTPVNGFLPPSRFVAFERFVVPTFGGRESGTVHLSFEVWLRLSDDSR